MKLFTINDFLPYFNLFPKLSKADCDVHVMAQAKSSNLGQKTLFASSWYFPIKKIDSVACEPLTSD